MDATASLPRSDTKVIGLISTAHFLSHVYMLVLPPLFPLLKDVYGVSFAALGLALTVFNVATGLTQAPMGFLVDRFGARAILIAGLIVEAIAIAAIGIFPSYWALIALMAVAGLANSVYHPADYTILSASVGQRRMGRAFSIHTFAGYFGFAVAPLTMVFLLDIVGWQMALVIVGAAGLAVALVLAAFASVLREDAPDAAAKPAPTAAAGPQGMKLLLSLPIVMGFLFFVGIAMTNGGFTSFGVSALVSIYDVAIVDASAPLTSYLFASAAGVLAGGWLADRTERHSLVAAGCFILVGLLVACVAAFDLTLMAVTVLFGLAGFFSGMVAPSRDMMIRSVTPAGSTGKVFGFVSTGFNLGGAITPLAFGLLLDRADPNMLFWAISALSIVTILTVLSAGSIGRRKAV
ncbi:MFS transporter [Oceanibaculum pacificum]|uniref:Fosmidomycin resistance protein n=1 Tax=Oceanibaculum pacificum TaxID=580166 RepID=A0A154WG56_9PROT|nr:MFS transporter [Oceanibaculum pacificum]KZD12510.1 Fosmidomycin resistance protein [Oceanibaculum pacificum]